jgi:hypothetical protein
MALCVLCALFGGCRGEANAGDARIVMELAISPTPPGVGPTRLIITLRDTLGLPVEGARIVVEGNMSHAGMTPVLDTATAERPGRYTVPEFGFTMAGDWILSLEAVFPDGRVARLQKPTRVVRAPTPPGG